MHHVSEKLDFTNYEGRPTIILDQIVKVLQLQNTRFHFMVNGIKRHNVEVEDAFIQIGVPENYPFFEVKEVQQGDLMPVVDKGVKYLASVVFTILEQETNSSRRKYGLFDLFGDIGGLMEILFLIGSWLVGTYAEHNFILKALSKLYMASTKEVHLFSVSKKTKSKEKLSKKSPKYAESVEKSRNSKHFEGGSM